MKLVRRACTCTNDVWEAKLCVGFDGWRRKGEILLNDATRAADVMKEKEYVGEHWPNDLTGAELTAGL